MRSVGWECTFWFGFALNTLLAQCCEMPFIPIDVFYSCSTQTKWHSSYFSVHDSQVTYRVSHRSCSCIIALTRHWCLWILSIRFYQIRAGLKVSPRVLHRLIVTTQNNTGACSCYTFSSLTFMSSGDKLPICYIGAQHESVSALSGNKSRRYTVLQEIWHRPDHVLFRCTYYGHMLISMTSERLLSF